MEKKILHTFRVLNSLFHEARFVYKTAPRGAEDETKTDADEEDKDGKPEDAEKKEVGKKAVEGKAETKEESVKERSTARREQLKKAERLPRRGHEVDTEEQRKDKEAEKKFQESIEVKLPVKEFLEKDATEQTNKLDWLRIDTSKINAQTWDHSTTEGLDKIKKDFVNLGIMNYPKDAEYYGTMFAVLYGAADKSNPYFAENNGEYIVAFKDSLSDKSKADISGLAAKGNFLGGEAYLKAFESLTQVRARAMVQDTGARNTRETQSKQGVDPIGTTTVDFVKSNISVLQKAARDRDYSTLGIYAVGAYALWKTVGTKLFGGGGHGDAHGAHGGGGGFDIKTWAMWGAAIYGADKLLKNAGYDVLKMAGFKDMNSEVKGTPMESMQNILSQSAVAKETADLDYGIVLKMSEQKLTDLDSFLKSSKTSGVDKFIHPREFPDLFPDLKNAWPFKKDQDINKPGDAVEREYARVGHQLYKLALALPVVYEKTLFKDHPKYTGLTYEMMLTDPGRSDLRVWKLLEAARQYAPESVGSGFLSGKKPQEIKDKMLAGTDKVLENNGFTLDNTTELKPGSGHIAGHLKGFPIVVVAVKEGYRIYLQSDYNDKLGYNATPGTKFKFIPLEGGKRGAEEAVKRVEDRMGELLKKLQEKNKNIGGLTYESGQWKAKIDFAGAEDLGVAEKKGVSVNVNVDELGQSLRLDGESSREKSIEKDVLNRILLQNEFKTLSVFSNANQLKVEDNVDGDGKATLVIGNNKTKIDIQFAAGKFSLEGGAVAEKAFIQNPSFAQDYIDALAGDKEFELNKNIGNLQELMSKSAPEGFVKHFFEALTQQTNKSAVSGFNLDTLSGAIPENFTSMVLATSKNEVMQRLRRSILGASSFAEVETARKEIIQDFNDKIKAISKVVADENVKLEREGKKWDRDAFMSRVVDRVRKASCISTTYSGAKADFENMVYKLPLPGFLTKKSDLSNASHEAAGQLMGVYVYYTAHLDNHKFEGNDIDLDHLTYPPTPTPGILDHTKDPALRGHMSVRYFEYVKNQIYNKANAMGDLSSIPSPTAVDVWQIKDFDVWAKEDGDYTALDPMDEKPAYTHDALHPAPGYNHSELDEAMIQEYKDVVATLIMEYPDVFNENAINDYLFRGLLTSGKNQDGSKIPAKDIGLLVIYWDSSAKKGVCKLWDKTNRIANSAGAKRSNQVRQMQNETDQFLDFIFTAKDSTTGNSRFFKQQPSLKASIVKRWPWLRNPKYFPDAINPFSD